MTTSIIKTSTVSADHFTGPIGAFFRTLAKRIRGIESEAATGKAIADLSREQLEDIGLDPSEVRPRPVMKVEAGLMANLMSLR